MIPELNKEQFLPIPIDKDSDEERKSQPNYIFEPDQSEIFNYLLPKHLKAQMWRILLESNAAELGAKMTAMDNATRACKDMIHDLTLLYNKARQAGITAELMDIVGGAEAQIEA